MKIFLVVQYSMREEYMKKYYQRKKKEKEMERYCTNKLLLNIHLQ